MLSNQFRPIVIIDSGIGGLFFASKFNLMNTHEDIIYYADDQFMPYGNKSKSKLNKRLSFIIDNLIKKYNIKMLILACNTATTTSLEYLRGKYQINIFGVSPNNLINDANIENVKILCTNATSNALNRNNTICLKNLAKYIETNFFNKTKLEKYCKNIIYKYELYKTPIIILGCTHYEMISAVFKRLLPISQIVIPSEECIKEIMKNYLVKDLKYKGSIRFECSSNSKAYLLKLKFIYNNIICSLTIK